jgi:hypothetical protein
MDRNSKLNIKMAFIVSCDYCERSHTIEKKVASNRIILERECRIAGWCVKNKSTACPTCAKKVVS